MKKENTEYLQFVQKYEAILIKLSQCHENGTNVEAIKHFFKFINRWLENESLTHVVKRIKELRLTTQRYLSGNPYQPNMVSTKKGLPKILHGSLRKRIEERDMESIKIALTMFYVSRHWTTTPDPDFDPILTPSEPFIEGLTPLIKEFIETYSLKVGTEYSSSNKFHLSTKQGPNGQAIGNSLFDLYTMDENLINEIIKLNPSIKAEINACKQYADFKFSNKDKGKLRKVVAISDKELKTRVIAVLDYWSQTALKPLHDSVMGQLRKFSSDFTKDQHGFEPLNLPDKVKYSLDLSNATDRFPLILQKALLKELIGEEKANSWGYILTNLPYEHKESNSVINYRVGQPMGAYSSWPIFTLTHHFVVYCGIKSLGLDPKQKHYMMLGDDIVIFGKLLADKYRSIMKDLKVEIAEHKSFESKDYFEFAKRSYYYGRDVSPYQIGAIVAARTPVETVTALRDLFRKNRRLERFPEFVYTVLRVVSVTSNDWKIRSLSNKLRALSLWPLYGKPASFRHTLIEYVRIAVPIPCGSLRLAEEKFLVALRRSIRATLIETCNTMNDWFDMISHELSNHNEDWETQNLPGKASKCIPLLVIKNREDEKFNDLLELAGQDGFGGVGGFIPNVVRLILSDPRKLAKSRSHLVISEMTTLLSQKTIEWLILNRDQDVRRPVQPLQLSEERLSALAKRLIDDTDDDY